MSLGWRVLPWALLACCVTLYSCEMQRRGVLTERLRVQGAQHTADSLLAASAVLEARIATQKADSARQAAQAQVRRSNALRAQTEASNAQASAERDRARQLLADSVATNDSLRAEVARLVDTGERVRLCDTERFAQDSTTIETLLGVIARDSLALQRQVVAIETLTARAEGAERIVRTLRAERPSNVWTWIKIGAAAYGGYQLGKGR